MPLEHAINKKEAELLLKQHEVINRVKCLENDRIIYIKYYLGNMKMNKQKMTIEDLALEMRAGFKSVNDRLDKVESRLDRVEKDIIDIKGDISILKREAIKHGWDLNPDNN